MKVLIVTAAYLPTINGVTTHVAALKKFLEQSGVEVTILCPKNNKRKGESGVVEMLSVPNPFNSDYPLPLSFIIPKAIKKQHFDVVHLHHPFGVRFVAERIVKKNQATYIFTNHTQYLEYTGYYLPIIAMPIRVVVKSILKNLYKKANAVICSTEDIKKSVLGINNHAKVHVIPVPINDAGLTDVGIKVDIRKRHGFSKNNFIYLYVGRVAKEKNIDLLINTFKEAHKKNKNLKLLVVGLGDYQKKFGEIEGVVFVGAVKAEELFYYYNQADCFVSASTSETLGLVFAEALYCETPVLGIDSPGVRDVVRDGENGELATGVKDFKKIFVEIPTKPSDIKKYQAMAKESAKNFTANVNLTKILELYKK